MIHEQLRHLAVPIDSIQPDPNNARRRTPKNLDAIKSSLAEFGQRKPVIVNQTTMHITAGNGTYEAAVALGWKEIAALLTDDTMEAAKRFAIVDNRSAELAEWDEEELLIQLEEIGDFQDLGFDDADLKEIVSHMGGEVNLDEVKFPEFTEAVADEVKYVECPKCKHKWPK